MMTRPLLAILLVLPLSLGAEAEDFDLAEYCERLHSQGLPSICSGTQRQSSEYCERLAAQGMSSSDCSTPDREHLQAIALNANQPKDEDICPADYSFRDYMEAVQRRQAGRGCGKIIRETFSSDSAFEAALERQGCLMADYCTDSSKTVAFKASSAQSLTQNFDEPDGQSLLDQYFAAPDAKLYVSCPQQDFAVWGEQDIYQAHQSVSSKIRYRSSDIPSQCSIRYINGNEFSLHNVSWHDPSAQYRQSSGTSVLLSCEYGFKVFARSYSGEEAALQMALSKARRQGLGECKAEKSLQPQLEQMIATRPERKPKPVANYKSSSPDPSSMVACEKYSQLVFNHLMGNRNPPPMRQVVVINQRRPTEYEGEITSCGMFSCTVELRETYRSSWNRQIMQTSDNLGQSFYELGRAIGQAAARADLRRKAEKRKKNTYQECLNAAGYSANGPALAPLELRVTNINNHTRGNKFYSSFNFTHRNGTRYELDVKPNANGYTLKRYADTTFRARDKTTGQDIELTVEASAWR